MDGTFLNPSTMETKTVQDQPELLSETLLGCGNSPWVRKQRKVIKCNSFPEKFSLARNNKKAQLSLALVGRLEMSSVKCFIGNHGIELFFFPLD